MTHGWLWEALYFALWAAGSAMVCMALLRAAAGMWSNRKQLQLMLGPVRPMKRFSYRDLPVIQRLADAMEIAGIRAPVEAVVGSMLFIGVFAWVAADLAVNTMKLRFALDVDKTLTVNTWVLNTMIAVLLGSLPYFYVLFRLQHVRHRMAMDMIKLVQNVIGHYNVNLTVQELISRSASTVPEQLREEWKRLELNSHMGTSLEEALYDFARRTDNAWAEDLADILLLKHTYGNDVIEALHKLVLDMQAAKKHEERRLSMVAVYRIGTCVMIAFAFLIVLFNVYADGANYRHYFVHPTGQWILLISGIVLFVSLIMVVKSGRRQF
jgi:Flp pilus assembly protein TadB